MNKKPTYHKITKTEAKRLIVQHHGKLSEKLGCPPHDMVYDLDNGMVLFTSTFERYALLRPQQEVYRPMPADPLEKDQKLLKHFESGKAVLLERLSSELGVVIDVTKYEQPYLDSLSKRIKKYGYEKAYENLYVPLIIFVGEQIIHQLGGSWEFEKGDYLPNRNGYVEDFLTPFVVDREGKKHYLFRKFLKEDLIETKGLSLYLTIRREIIPNPFGTFDLETGKSHPKH
jgi:hypothetical protein